MKIAVLFDRFGPYHVARIRGASGLARILAVEGAPHRAVYDWVPAVLPDGIEYQALTSRAGEESDPAIIERRLEECLTHFAPDAIALPGWSNLITLLALRWAHRNGIAAVCMSESNAWDFERRAISEFAKRAAVAHYGAGLATNASQINYLAELGLRPEAIFSGYNVVDNAFFREQAAQWRARPILPSEIANQMPREAKGRYFLASNRFIPKKNLVRMLEAYAEFRSDRPHDRADWPIVLLGDGELRGAIEAKIAELGLDDFVYLPGFLQIESLVRYYGTAGGFIHASTTEQWGLVINEAMAAGLPVGASNRCGATHYLIENGTTGFSFDPYSTKEIAKAMKSVSELESNSALLKSARAKVDELTPQRFGENLAAAATFARENRPEPGLLDRLTLKLLIDYASRSPRF